MGVKAKAVLLVTMLFSGGCETFYGPTSPSNDWAVFESARYTLNTRPGSFCESQAGSLAELLEDQYAHTVSVLQIEPGARISMFLYNSGSELTPPLSSPRSGVAFPETNAAHAVCVAPFDDDLRGLLAHEANHVIIQNGLGRAGTSFMNEGLASAVRSERFGNIGPAALHAWVRNNPGRVVPLAELIDDAKWNSNSSDRYGSSASFLAFVIERYGAARLKQLYHASSAQLPGRMREVYGTAMEGLETEWRTAVSAR
jgi:hypothetical protein